MEDPGADYEEELLVWFAVRKVCELRRKGESVGARRYNAVRDEAMRGEQHKEESRASVSVRMRTRRAMTDEWMSNEQKKVWIRRRLSKGAGLLSCRACVGL